MTWYVYILRCGDGSLYTGVTTDPEQRLNTHNKGRGSKYVRSRGAARVVYTEAHRNRSTASRRESVIKGWVRTKKLELIRGSRVSS